MPGAPRRPSAAPPRRPGRAPGVADPGGAASGARGRKPIARPDALDGEMPTLARATARRRRPAPEPDPMASAPHLTLPSVESARPSARRPAARPDVRPDVRQDTDGHRTLLGGLRAQRALRDLPDDPWDRERWDGQGWDDDPRRDRDRDEYDEYDEYEGYGDARRGRPRNSSGRLRSASAARPVPAKWRTDPRAVATLDDALPMASVPDMVAYRPPRARPRVDTRAIMRKAGQRARSPWSLARLVLTLLAAAFALSGTYSLAGEPSQPLMGFQALGDASAARADWPVNSVVARVQPFTQMRRSDLYDTVDQFNQWGGAACSAAVLSEVLTAYGVPGATIGRMIDELGPQISPSGGLLDYGGFARVAALHGYRADIRLEDQRLTYAQMKYITNTLGLPIIINVHISYGYYHFFAGGHFLVMTAGDDQGARIVDSSLYFVKYLPYDTLNSMFTWRTVVIVPRDFQYTLPS